MKRFTQTCSRGMVRRGSNLSALGCTLLFTCIVASIAAVDGRCRDRCPSCYRAVVLTLIVVLVVLVVLVVVVALVPRRRSRLRGLDWIADDRVLCVFSTFEACLLPPQTLSSYAIEGMKDVRVFSF